MHSSERFSGLTLILPVPQLREQDHIADAITARQHHHEAVDANADAPGGWHAVFQGEEEILIDLLHFFAGLVLEPGALHHGIVQFGISLTDLYTVDDQLVNIHDGGKRHPMHL